MELSFAERHTKQNQKKYGVWRWKGLFENRKKIVSFLKDSLVLDLGGALAPLGFNSEILDREKKDINGNDIKHNSFNSVKKLYDVVFSSHFLEHVKEFKYFINMMLSKLKADGNLILHLPSDKGAEYWHPSVKKGHHWIFCLKNINPGAFDKYTIPIDFILEVEFGLNLKVCKYVSDNSILIIADRGIF